ncbi:unnamed protein product, partial [Choristocarpus tenellus]
MAGVGNAGQDLHVTGSVEDKSVQKKQRMLRNRESAALSRKRKREKIDDLEAYIRKLEAENAALRQKMDQFESRNHTS